jgi:hypothetical protein
MATIFSSLFNSSGSVEPGIGTITEELGLDTQRRASVGHSHARVRRTVAQVSIGTVAGSGDQVRMMTFKSSDILHSLLFSTNGAGSAGEADLGWYKTGMEHDGALASTNSVDAFSTTALVFDTATSPLRTEKIFAGDYASKDMGKRVWELINISDAATYTADPGGTFDLTMTMTETMTGTVTLVTLEALYTAGD